MKMKLGSRWCWGVEVMVSRVEEELDVSVEQSRPEAGNSTNASERGFINYYFS